MVGGYFDGAGPRVSSIAPLVPSRLFTIGRAGVCKVRSDLYLMIPSADTALERQGCEQDSHRKFSHSLERFAAAR